MGEEFAGTATSSKSLTLTQALRPRIRKTFFCLMTFTTAVMGSMVGPFLSREMLANGMSSAGLGLLFSLYSLMVVCFSPLVGQFAHSVSRRLWILRGGLPVLICFILVQGFTESQPIVLYIARAMQGIAGGACLTCSYGLIPDWYPKDRDWMISLSEVMAAVGYMVGPLVGGLFYSLGGYPMPFVGTSVPLFLLLILLPFVGGAEEEQEQRGGGSKAERASPAFTDIVNSTMIAAMLAAFVVEFSFSIWGPIFSPWLLSEYGAGSFYAGVVMAIPATSYGLCNFALPRVYTWASRPKILSGGLVIFGVMLCLMNPCQFFPELCPWRRLRLVLLTAVQLILGASSTFAFVPSLPLMLDSVDTEKFPGDSHGVVAGAWNAMVAMGQVLGPFVAEFLSRWMSFPAIMTTQGFTVIFVAFLIVFLASDPKNTHKSPKYHVGTTDSNETTKLRSSEFEGPSPLHANQDYGAL